MKTTDGQKRKETDEIQVKGAFRVKKGFLVMRIFSLFCQSILFVCFLRMRKTLGCEPRIRANKKIKLKNPEQGGND